MAKHCPKHGKQLVERLRGHRLKATRARLALLDALEHASRPLSVKVLAEKAKGLNADIATLYRNVEKLRGLGLVDRVDFQDGVAYYEMSGHGHHHHIVCQGCGKIEKLKGCSAGKLETAARKSSGFAEVYRHSLEFFGLCIACKKSSANN